ncbi:hypothetical protein P168DRAFT_39672 [Aspergillus campestris IBT 28561]|uniref:Uncharacterized protein n=1 Tax=Aspergillus campestris (strain IBT 28561) TaxID=1392248 RepID=A0A2I1CWJ7_ASPC2|nr:uncharacterized protein P168DRAFT_39672 [Aspergillus campestris IBT 28561]PKY01996.1 hypothetical protein P168DRAFT_39672 [Aspergillus campestris IBT 28561]
MRFVIATCIHQNREGCIPSQNKRRQSQIIAHGCQLNNRSPSSDSGYQDRASLAWTGRLAGRPDRGPQAGLAGLRIGYRLDIKNRPPEKSISTRHPGNYTPSRDVTWKASHGGCPEAPGDQAGRGAEWDRQAFSGREGACGTRLDLDQTKTPMVWG